jgi:hypothetical protein
MKPLNDAVFAIEWRVKGSNLWRHWAFRWTERAARLWIERESARYSHSEFRVVRFLREEPASEEK